MSIVTSHNRVYIKIETTIYREKSIPKSYRKPKRENLFFSSYLEIINLFKEVKNNRTDNKRCLVCRI